MRDSSLKGVLTPTGWVVSLTPQGVNAPFKRWVLAFKTPRGIYIPQHRQVIAFQTHRQVTAFNTHRQVIAIKTHRQVLAVKTHQGSRSLPLPTALRGG